MFKKLLKRVFYKFVKPQLVRCPKCRSFECDGFCEDRDAEN